MAVESYTVQLERVQAAIAAIEGGAQSYSIGSRSLTRANLSELYEREERLLGKVARETRGGGIRVRLATPT